MTFDGRFLAFFTIPAGETISVTNGGGGPTAVAITAGSYTITTLVTMLQSVLQAQRAPSGTAWTVTVSTGASGTGKVTIDAPTDTFSITWTSTNLRDVLGFDVNIASVTTAQTGANQARGLWMPDHIQNLDGNYLSAPRSTDLRQTESPAGLVIGHVGSTKYRHLGLRYSHVPAKRTWLASEVTVNESLERFLMDVQWGVGHAWFSPSSKCQIIAHTGSAVGNGTVTGWYLVGAGSMDECVKRAVEGYDAFWSFSVPRIVSDS